MELLCGERKGDSVYWGKRIYSRAFHCNMHRGGSQFQRNTSHRFWVCVTALMVLALGSIRSPGSVQPGVE